LANSQRLPRTSNRYGVEDAKYPKEGAFADAPDFAADDIENRNLVLESLTLGASPSRQGQVVKNPC